MVEINRVKGLMTSDQLFLDFTTDLKDWSAASHLIKTQKAFFFFFYCGNGQKKHFTITYILLL